jgi:hypothetical protein
MADMMEVSVPRDLDSAQVAAVTNDPVDVDFDDTKTDHVSDDGDLYMEELKDPLAFKKESILHILEGVPPDLKRFIKLRAFLEEQGLSSDQYLLGKMVPRSGFLIYILPWKAVGLDEVRELPRGMSVRRIRNPRREAQHSLIVYGVPLDFSLDNFHDVLGEALSGTKRWTRGGSKEPSDIVELNFHDPADTAYHARAQRLLLEGMSFRVSPKFHRKTRICRVCKKINPGHSPGHCRRIVCGKCSGSHATRDHPADEQKICCPACSQDHEFTRCPRRSEEMTRSLRQQHKSYKEALEKKRSTPIPSPPTQTLSSLLTEDTILSALGDPQQRLFLENLMWTLFTLLRPSHLPFPYHEAKAPATTIQEIETPPPSPPGRSTTMSTPKINPAAELGHRTPELKKPKQGSSTLPTLPCPKGCGYMTTKAGPLKVHTEACTGESWLTQKKSKAKLARSKKASPDKTMTEPGQSVISFGMASMVSSSSQ